MCNTEKLAELKKYYDLDYFNEEQIVMILRGMNCIFPITLYANPTYEATLIQNIIICLIRMCELGEIYYLDDNIRIFDWSEVKPHLPYYEEFINLLSTVQLSADKVALFAKNHGLGELWW